MHYAMPINVIVFLVAFWTAIIYGLATRNWLGSVLWLTAGFAALTSPRLSPPVDELDEAFEDCTEPLSLSIGMQE